MAKNRIDVDYAMSHKMGLDDTFEFHCKACGKCCKHRTDVLLTAYDVFRIARYLGRTLDDIIERYCEVYKGPDSHLPIVRIRPNPPDNACPFLRDRKCIVHKDKPMVCAVYPLSRAFEYGTDAPYYVLQTDVTCGRRDRTVSVRQWMGPLCNEESEQAGTEWGDLTAILGTGLVKSWNSMPNPTKEDLLNTLYPILYLNYDIREPFLPQLEHNAVGALLISSVALHTESVPEWLEIPDHLKPRGKCALLLRKAYHRYKKQWCAQRGLTLVQGELMQGDPDAEHFIGLEGFKQWFCALDTVKEFLTPHDLFLWQQLGDIPGLLESEKMMELPTADK